MPVTVDVAIELLSGQLPPGDTEFQLVALGNVELGSTKGPSLFGAARLADVLVVGAVDAETPTAASPYSSSGDPLLRLPDVVAPSGVDTSGFGMRFWGTFRGTSSAAAHAAAVAALLSQASPGSSQDEIRDAIRSTAGEIGSGVGDPRSGNGLVDAIAAAQLLAGDPLNTDDPPEPEKGTLVEFYESLPQWLQVSVPSDQQIEDLLSRRRHDHYRPVGSEDRA